MSLRSILIVAPHFHAPSALHRLARSLMSQEGESGWSLLVVDNGSTSNEKDELAKLRQVSPRIDVVYAPRNLGYFGGVEFGRQHALESGEAPEWLVIANQDIEFEKSFMQQLASLTSSRSLAVIAPSILSRPGGVEMNPYMRIRPSLARTLLRAAVFSTIAGARMAVRLSERRGRASVGHPTPGPCTLYAPHGSLIVCGRAFFESGGSLRWSAFLFGEEIFLAEQILTMGVGIRYLPGLRAVHYAGSSTSDRTNGAILHYKKAGILAASKLLLRRRASA